MPCPFSFLLLLPLTGPKLLHALKEMYRFGIHARHFDYIVAFCLSIITFDMYRAGWTRYFRGEFVDSVQGKPGAESTERVFVMAGAQGRGVGGGVMTEGEVERAFNTLLRLYFLLSITLSALLALTKETKDHKPPAPLRPLEDIVNAPDHEGARLRQRVNFSGVILKNGDALSCSSQGLVWEFHDGGDARLIESKKELGCLIKERLQPKKEDKLSGDDEEKVGRAVAACDVFDRYEISRKNSEYKIAAGSVEVQSQYCLACCSLGVGMTPLFFHLLAVNLYPILSLNDPNCWFTQGVGTIGAPYQSSKVLKLAGLRETFFVAAVGVGGCIFMKMTTEWLWENFVALIRAKKANVNGKKEEVANQNKSQKQTAVNKVNVEPQGDAPREEILEVPPIDEEVNNMDNDEGDRTPPRKNSMGDKLGDRSPGRTPPPAVKASRARLRKTSGARGRHLSTRGRKGKLTPNPTPGLDKEELAKKKKLREAKERLREQEVVNKKKNMTKEEVLAELIERVLQMVLGLCCTCACLHLAFECVVGDRAGAFPISPAVQQEQSL